MSRKYLTKVFILLLPVMMVASSCNKWLEATSSSEISDEKMLSSRAGFHEALNGVYVLMSSKATYSAYWTFAVNELVAYPFTMSGDAGYASFQQHKFSSSTCVDAFDDMWRGGYKVIANANKLLGDLESHRDIVTSDYEYSLMRGELLGIRALMHFELLRMFGLADWSGDNASKLTIPYVRSYDKEATPQRSYAETVALLWEDLDESIELLSGCDPLLGDPDPDFAETVNTDGYWSSRSIHFNYYAAKALSAQILLWQGEITRAAAVAKDVVDGAFESGLVKWTDAEELINSFVTDKDPSSGNNPLMTGEGIFCADASTGYSSVMSFYAGNVNKTVSIDRSWTPNIFPPSLLASDEDIRGRALWMQMTTMGYSLSKFMFMGSLSVSYDTSGDRIVVASEMKFPIIRLSEMYYIMAEDALVRGDRDAALSALDAVRSHRGITLGFDPDEGVVAPVDPETGLPDPDFDAEAAAMENIWTELEREYYREFIGEGRLVFYLKRRASLGRPVRVPNPLCDGSDIIYPYPVSEQVLGRVQQL